jgi:hypothetical protein
VAEVWLRCGATPARRQNIEKSTRTRVIVADKRVHILGAVDNIHQVRRVSTKAVLLCGRRARTPALGLWLLCILCPVFVQGLDLSGLHAAFQSAPNAAARPLAGRTPACVQAKTVISDLVLGRPAAKANRKLAAISGRLKRDL